MWKEPVLLVTVARLLVLVGARFGLELDGNDLLAALVAAEVALAPVLRSLVSPTAKTGASQ